MVAALGDAVATGAPLRRVLLASDLIGEDEYVPALALRCGVMALNRADHPADQTLAGLLPAETCLTHGALPWMWIGTSLVVAATSRAGFDAVRAPFDATGQAVIMAAMSEADIHAEIGARYGRAMVEAAETWVPDAEACRDLGHAGAARVAIASSVTIASVGLLALAPLVFFAALLIIAVVSLLLTQALKLAALIAARKPPPRPGPPRHPLPDVTLLVPLFREAAIARALIDRLSRLSYPKSCLSVLLILEDIDRETASILAAADLPGWVRIVVVPGGSIQTKPRALNYALRFSKGSVIGILDAEDA